MSSEIHTRVLEVVKTTFQVDNLPSSVNQDTIEKWDSMGHIRLVVSLEKKFGIRFSMEIIPSLTSSDRIIEYLEAQKELS